MCDRCDSCLQPDLPNGNGASVLVDARALMVVRADKRAKLDSDCCYWKAIFVGSAKTMITRRSN